LITTAALSWVFFCRPFADPVKDAEAARSAFVEARGVLQSALDDYASALASNVYTHTKPADLPALQGVLAELRRGLDQEAEKREPFVKALADYVVTARRASAAYRRAALTYERHRRRSDGPLAQVYATLAANSRSEAQAMETHADQMAQNSQSVKDGFAVLAEIGTFVSVLEGFCRTYEVAGMRPGKSQFDEPLGSYLNAYAARVALLDDIKRTITAGPTISKQ
jgi:hypothetical protein